MWMMTGLSGPPYIPFLPPAARENTRKDFIDLRGQGSLVRLCICDAAWILMARRKYPQVSDSALWIIIAWPCKFVKVLRWFVTVIIIDRIKSNINVRRYLCDFDQNQRENFIDQSINHDLSNMFCALIKVTNNRIIHYSRNKCYN